MIVESKKAIDKKVVFMASVLSLMILYFVNPFAPKFVTEWDRTFCHSYMSGISFESRISHFYLLLFVFVPLTFAVSYVLYDLLNQIRSKCMPLLFRINVLFLFPVVMGYLTRYIDNANQPYNMSTSAFIVMLVCLNILLLVISFIDVNSEFDFSDYALAVAAYFVMSVLFILMSTVEEDAAIKCLAGFAKAAAAVVVYSFVVLKVNYARKYKACIKNIIYILLWLPVVMRVTLGVIYFMVENGFEIEMYRRYVSISMFLFVLLAILAVVGLKKKNVNLNFKTFGYIGAILGFCIIGFLNLYYKNYVWNPQPNMFFEWGNNAVGYDTFLHGKLPIIDYFSAHAGADVFKWLIDCFLHNVHEDSNAGAFVVYNGAYLEKFISYILLYCIIKNFVDKDDLILGILLIPFSSYYFLMMTPCLLSIAALIAVMKKPTIKCILLHWIALLFSAVYRYDHGIYLGMGVIFSYIFICCVKREWKNLRNYIISGFAIGCFVTVFAFVYASMTDLDLISRIKEWLSLSVGSNSTWAMYNFGDATKFTFLLVYFVIPITNLAVLVITAAKFIKTKQEPVLAAMIMAFDFAYFGFIPRSIVSHSLMGGITEVLLNYIPWILSLFVVYVFTLKKENGSADINRNFFAWAISLGIVFITGSSVIRQSNIGMDSILPAQAMSVSKNFILKNNVKENIGQERISYTDDMKNFLDSFETIFDSLLTDDQTFLDFTNMTPLYVFTGRERPFYVGQSPSSLTDLYSQQCYLDEVEEHDCPLAVLGTSDTDHLQSMWNIPHNIRYYKIAEYIYAKYRPLVNFNEFSIWCEKENYDKYRQKLVEMNLPNDIYALVDYGYDQTEITYDQNGGEQCNYKPFHKFDLAAIPYIWANSDKYGSVNNPVLAKLDEVIDDVFVFDGSQSVLTDKGNYVLLEFTNNTQETTVGTIALQEVSNLGKRYEYSFNIFPGKNKYMIRASQDYFWSAYNINMISISHGDSVETDSVEILEGD